MSDVDEEMADHEFVAQCQSCGLEIGVDNQAALDTVVGKLTSAEEGCTEDATHAFEQVRP